MKHDFSNKKVAILGFGVNNSDLVPYLQKRGASITICDKNSKLPQDISDVSYQLGNAYLDNLTNFNVLVRTPGLPYLTPQIQEAKQAGVLITSQTQLFLEECPAKTIGVTGTKGKGTTATYIQSCIKTAQEKGEIKGDVFLAGNIGASAIGLLETLQPDDWVILELSSFQLQDMTVSPHIAVVLEITSDHLDHHHDVDEYHNAKKNIIHYQSPTDFAILDYDSPVSFGYSADTHGQLFYFSLNALHPDQNGAFSDPDGTIYLRDAHLGEVAVCAWSDLAVPGNHNVSNASAAVVASALAGASLESIKTGLISFKGLPHRLQSVSEKQGVKYYDDSKSTTPDSTIAAIRSFDQPITLILGGSSKGADYTELIQALASSSVTTIICIGQEGNRLQTLLREADAKQQIIDGAKTMPEIVQQAKDINEPGSVVLLSPAAASFDMFKNAEDRGEQFEKAVKELV